MAYITSILESFLGTHRKHNEDSGQISFDCPACSYDKDMLEGDGKGNLEINYNKDVFQCWVCSQINDMRGPVSKLIKRYGNPKTLKDYIMFKPEAFFSTETKKVIVIQLPDEFKALKDCTSIDFKYDRAMYYLKSRGITNEIIEKFNIGYATSGKFYNRIIIPSYDEFGKLNYFVARWFDKSYTIMKYKNPEIEKLSIVFNEDKINWDATIYLVEGATDHIVVPNSIPLLGKVLSDILIDKLYEKAKSNIVILLDADAEKNAIILYHRLNFGRLTGRIRICIPPYGDPSKINEKEGKVGIIKLLKRNKKLKY